MDYPLKKQDDELKQVKTLPAAASTAANATAFDLQGVTTREDFDGADLHIAAPALTTVQLPDDKTVTYKVETSADNTTFVTLYDGIMIQTGAAAAGAAAKEIAVPIRGSINGTSGNLRRYVRAVATTGAATGDCSAASMTVTLRF